MGNEPDMVMFLDAQGNEVSNDPRWITKQQIQRFEDTVTEPELSVTAQGVEAPALADRDATWLKEEVKRRRDAGREIDTKGVTKKAQLVKLLEADDEAREEEALASLNDDTNPNGTPPANPDDDDDE